MAEGWTKSPGTRQLRTFPDTPRKKTASTSRKRGHIRPNAATTSIVDGGAWWVLGDEISREADKPGHFRTRERKTPAKSLPVRDYQKAAKTVPEWDKACHRIASRPKRLLERSAKRAQKCPIRPQLCWRAAWAGRTSASGRRPGRTGDMTASTRLSDLHLGRRDHPRGRYFRKG
jgi:hypothetical protein